MAEIAEEDQGFVLTQLGRDQDQSLVWEVHQDVAFSWVE